jgi:hypothetical protein
MCCCPKAVSASYSWTGQTLPHNLKNRTADKSFQEEGSYNAYKQLHL